MSHCAACAAKDQSILLLADQVDWLRSRITGVPVTTEQPAPKFADPGELWASDDEEDITAAIEAGAISREAGEAALASIQAFNQTLEVVT